MQRSVKEVEDLLEKVYSGLIKTLEVKVVDGIDGSIIINDPLKIKQNLREVYTIGYKDGCLDRTGAKKIECFKEGEKTRTFLSIVHAASFFEVTQSSIQTSIREKTKCKGYNFRFKK